MFISILFIKIYILYLKSTYDKNYQTVRIIRVGTTVSYLELYWSFNNVGLAVFTRLHHDFHTYSLHLEKSNKVSNKKFFFLWNFMHFK